MVTHRSSGRNIWLAPAVVWLLSCASPPESLLGSWPEFRALPLIPSGVHPNTLVVSDLDRDGDLDIAVPAVLDTSVLVLRNQGDGTFERISTTPWDAGALDAAVADLDGDGAVEIVATTFADNRVLALSARAGGTFEVTGNVAVEGEPTCLALADVVGDRSLDLLVTRGQENDMWLFEGDSAGDFTLAETVSLARRPTAMAVADFDGDGASDIAVVSSIANELAILSRHAGDARYQVRATAPLSGWPASLLPLDLDRDGELELVGATNLGDSLFIAEFSRALGGGLAIHVREQEAGYGSFGVAAADFDRDGWIDLAVTDKFADTVTLFQNIEGELEPRVSYPTGGGPTPVEAADFDGDGIADLVVANGFSNDISLFLSSR